MKIVLSLLCLLLLAALILSVFEQDPSAETALTLLEQQKAYEQRKADEAESKASVEREYARQDGKSERMMAFFAVLPATLLILGVIAVGGGAVYLYHMRSMAKTDDHAFGGHLLPAPPPPYQALPYDWGQYRYEDQRMLPQMGSTSLPVRTSQPPAHQPVIIVARTVEELEQYARSVNAHLVCDHKGYKLRHSNGSQQRLLPQFTDDQGGTV